MSTSSNKRLQKNNELKKKKQKSKIDQVTTYSYQGLADLNKIVHTLDKTNFGINNIYCARKDRANEVKKAIEKVQVNPKSVTVTPSTEYPSGGPLCAFHQNKTKTNFTGETTNYDVMILLKDEMIIVDTYIIPKCNLTEVEQFMDQRKPRIKCQSCWCQTNFKYNERFEPWKQSNSSTALKSYTQIWIETRLHTYKWRPWQLHYRTIILPFSDHWSLMINENRLNEQPERFRWIDKKANEYNMVEIKAISRNTFLQ